MTVGLSNFVNTSETTSGCVLQMEDFDYGSFDLDFYFDLSISLSEIHTGRLEALRSEFSQQVRADPGLRTGFDTHTLLKVDQQCNNDKIHVR